ncbi:MAG: hypothetical protein UZ16_OP3001002441 [Candidatus Hinthialibacteria bacterium OLB16]|nr:MAG: hypothetical protein UZ16_OP3001002441 [Candidatus Hinthialibacteria bacterium OLB16]
MSNDRSSKTTRRTGRKVTTIHGKAALTSIQIEIWEFIRNHVEENGYPPPCVRCVMLLESPPRMGFDITSRSWPPMVSSFFAKERGAGRAC